ncbi:MAG: hypothetical protein P8K68_14610 [Algibacter sp.]|uniref:hypothetical protein n=1 Tax=Algibacter sp. TaxID=1872428 RepID=UPI00260F92F5|nr:hypothetical protein [Algibacter sp.]MDG1730189.1 hypothetical protein [Algibacter sp.]MDG2179998.1 hypothetical protein [Algibacter sp.]
MMNFFPYGESYTIEDEKFSVTINKTVVRIFIAENSILDYKYHKKSTSFEMLL